MRNSLPLLLATAVIASIFVACNSESEPVYQTQMNRSLTAPKAAKKDKVLSVHGDDRRDPYYWLNERENQEVIDYLKAENEYTEGVMKPLENFQERLFEEMKGRIKETDMSVPYKAEGWYYYSRFEEGQEYPIYCRKLESLDAPEEVILNVNELAKDHEYYQAVGLALSTNKNLLVYGEDTVSRRIYTLRFKNLTSGEVLPFKVENTTGGAAWANDNQTVFFTRKDETLRGHQIWKYKLGSDPSSAELVYQEPDETFNCFVYKSKSKKYIMIGTSSTLSTEYHFLDADNPDGDFRVIHPREEDLEYGVGHMGDKFYVHTNWNAKNFRLMQVDENTPGKENWQELIPHREDILLEDVEMFKDYLVLEERIKGILNVRVMHWDGSDDHYVDFGEDAFTAYATSNMEFDSEELRLSYTSLTTPGSVYDYNMATRKLKLLKQQEVIGQFDPKWYRSERINVEARDGKKVPLSLVYHKDTPLDGSAPALLYGYGSYGHNVDPYFSSVRLSLLDRGFVFAIAHVRGSETLGRAWYEDGKMLNKKNTFYDFIDCGQWLVSNKYSHPEGLFAMGGSAGGLLMGAVVNFNPEMWRGVVAQVPFVDVVTTMLDESIPLTTGEYDEWGNPNDEEYYHYIKSYSPYDNVEAKAYPNMLVTTGLHDSQVQYWEPAKWVARLREMKTDDNLLLLQTEMDFGHSGASGRFESLKEVALEYAFILDLAGKADSDSSVDRMSSIGEESN